MRNATPVAISYFGKIPSRGDFVKSAENMALIQMIDHWIAEAMDLLTADPRWKIKYDEMPALHFAFIGPRRRHAIAGHIVASCDEAQRRFPFLAMGTMETDEPVAFVQRHPLTLGRLWAQLQARTEAAVNGADPAGALHALANQSIDLELSPGAYDPVFMDFMQMQSVGTLTALLRQAGFSGSARQIMLALGILLEPVMDSGSNQLERSLMIPLPEDPISRHLVASFWMSLITPFLLKVDFELAVFYTRIGNLPCMIVGFSGASPKTLQAIMDPQEGEAHHISFEDVQWVEEMIHSSPLIYKFSAYLEQQDLSLESAKNSFRDTFIGV